MHQLETSNGGAEDQDVGAIFSGTSWCDDGSVWWNDDKMMTWALRWKFWLFLMISRQYAIWNEGEWKEMGHQAKETIRPRPQERRIDRVSLFTPSSLITASDSMSSMHFTCAVTARYSLCRSEIWANIAHRHRPLTRYQSQSSVQWNNRKRNVPVSYVGWQHSFRWSVSLRQLT